jgi:hypothetical protein
VATERTNGVMMEPLEDAVLVEDVGVEHGLERQHGWLCTTCSIDVDVVLMISIGQHIEADGTVIVLGEHHLFETHDGLAGGGDGASR